MVRSSLFGAAILVSLAAMPAHASGVDCAARLTPPSVADATAITARALVELRDFGGIDNRASSAAPFSLSPDGKWISLILRRADADSDSYCHGVLLLSADGMRPPRLLDVGGAYISMVGDSHGIANMPNGGAAVVAPAWAPDGRSLLYIRRDKGVSQAWIVGLDGAPARQVSHMATDVREVRWASDGRHILVTTRPGVRDEEIAIEREGRSGFHYDVRFWPLAESKPKPVSPIPTLVQSISLNAGTVETARGEDDDQSKGTHNAIKPQNAVLYAESTAGARAWTIKTDPSRYTGPAGMHVSADGRDYRCPDAICAERVAGLWWTGPRKLVFVRGGSPTNGGRDAIYRWDLDRDPVPRLILETADALFGCQISLSRLLCAVEQASKPRSIMAIDLLSGKRRTVFDPNRDFPSANLGPVRRLRWDAGGGAISYGDLVLPPSHRTGQRHPLVVVQYESRGFLRGGTGDENPIYLLAARGYAVLSVQRTNWPEAALRGRDFAEFERGNIDNFADRKLLVASLEAGVDAAIALGVVDPTRIGLTGMSDGATTAEYILSHPNRFRAASLSSCCGDPSTMLFAAGLVHRDMVLSSGYPAPGASDGSFWRESSIATNADRMKVPLLLQMADREYRGALETFSALQLRGAAVDMYVFPDEYHVKWHPAHRLAEYDRVVAWFDFWLRDTDNGEPSNIDQTLRWKVMKQRLEAGS